jgi:hypothetical protein
MSLTGYLSDYSLPEIFQFVEQGYKTGLLSIQPESDAFQEPEKVHYLWIQGGRIMAVAEQLDNKGLLSMFKQRGWLKPEILNLLQEWSELEQQPLGLYLKSHGAMSAEQLKLIFHAQVLQRVCSLFKLPNGQFKFESKATLSKAEMTGLSLSAAEASLLGLRVLRDWTALTEKLPDATCGLNRVKAGRPQLHLDAQEWQVWEFTNGSTSINAIAKQLQLPVETVRQIAFRLSVTGLVEEVPIAAPEKSPAVEEKTPALALASTQADSMKVSFLQNLVGFLKTKVA